MTYRTIEDCLWDDPKVARLDPSAKLAFVYLITNRYSHVSGIYALPPVIAATETALGVKGWDRVSDTLSGLGFAKFDGERNVVWVVNMFRYQARGEKADRAAAKHLPTLHKSPLILMFLDRYPSVRRYLPDGFLDRVSDGGSGVDVQEQEKDQQQEQKNDPSSRSRAASRDIERVFEFWVKAFRLNGVRLTPERRKKIATRIRDCGMDKIERCLRGWASDPWRHEDPQRYELTKLLASQTKVEQGIQKGLERAKPPPAPVRGGSEQDERSRFEEMAKSPNAERAEYARKRLAAMKGER